MIKMVMFCVSLACESSKGVKDDGWGTCECINAAHALNDDETACDFIDQWSKDDEGRKEVKAQQDEVAKS